MLTNLWSFETLNLRFWTGHPLESIRRIFDETLQLIGVAGFWQKASQNRVKCGRCKLKDRDIRALVLRSERKLVTVNFTEDIFEGNPADILARHVN